jgi:hypothetical protein
MSEEHRKAFTELSEMGLKALRRILDGSDETARAGDVIRAADVAFDRAWGKPIQSVDANVTDNTRRIDTSKLTEAQRSALAEVAILSMNIAEEPESSEPDDQS